MTVRALHALHSEMSQTPIQSNLARAQVPSALQLICLRCRTSGVQTQDERGTMPAMPGFRISRSRSTLTPPQSVFYMRLTPLPTNRSVRAENTLHRRHQSADKAGCAFTHTCHYWEYLSLAPTTGGYTPCAIHQLALACMHPREMV